MNIEPKKVWVVGHKNPDTDSICAAISYAYLKNQLGERQYVPKRAGAISEETRYVLDYFKVEDPELITDVGAQLKDISIRKTAGISSQISLKKAWETMKKLDVVTLPVTNRLGKLEGVIVTKDIATSYMDVYDNRVLSKREPSIRILQRLWMAILSREMNMHILSAEKSLSERLTLDFYRNTSKRMIWSFSDRRKKCRFVH